MLSPSINQRYCWGVIARASASLRGHWKLPFSSRLYSSTNPSPSKYSVLILSLRLPQNRNSVRLNGSRWNCDSTMDARPSIPRRRSVYPQAMYTCSARKSFSLTSGCCRLPVCLLHPRLSRYPLPLPQS